MTRYGTGMDRYDQVCTGIGLVWDLTRYEIGMTRYVAGMTNCNSLYLSNIAHTYPISAD